MQARSNKKTVTNDSDYINTKKKTEDGEYDKLACPVVINTSSEGTLVRGSARKHHQFPETSRWICEINRHCQKFMRPLKVLCERKFLIVCTRNVKDCLILGQES